MGVMCVARSVHDVIDYQTILYHRVDGDAASPF